MGDSSFSGVRGDEDDDGFVLAVDVGADGVSRVQDGAAVLNRPIHPAVIAINNGIVRQVTEIRVNIHSVVCGVKFRQRAAEFISSVCGRFTSGEFTKTAGIGNIGIKACCGNRRSNVNVS